MYMYMCVCVSEEREREGEEREGEGRMEDGRANKRASWNYPGNTVVSFVMISTGLGDL